VIEILCPKTGLQVYGSRQSCNRAITDHSAEAAYECRFCGWFHIGPKEMCEVTGKRTFLSERAAIDYVERAWTHGRWTNRHGRMPRRAYQCEHCHGWHLTRHSEVHVAGEHLKRSAA
jgi:predicted RNA-binding Zn-ribbon protein involved in translation (DUF1610 family)